MILSSDRERSGMVRGNFAICISAIFHLLAQFPVSKGLIGYDCVGSTANLTTVSLLEVGECNIPQQEVNVTQPYIQLVQVNQYFSIHIKQCKIEIFRKIQKCGMFSHTLEVPFGEYSYINSIPYHTCIQLHRSGTTRIGRTEITGIKPNATTHRPVMIAGYIHHDSSCEGAIYSDPYGNWDDVIVHGSAKISLRDYTAEVDVDTNKVYLRSGTRCELSEGNCVDVDGGDTFWDPLPEDNCNSKRYGLLYEGIANKIISHDSGARQTVYSLETGNVVFALATRSMIRVCRFTLIRTEHPKLLIVETHKDEPFIAQKPIDVSNLDIFSYVNSKFVYVEKHISTQIKTMYRDILVQRCNLERQMLQNTLGMARYSPDEFAYNLMKGPGYMALLAGEVAHIVKCIPVEVKYRRTTECYNEMPVYNGNRTHHMRPKTHILTGIGTLVTCNRLVAPRYVFDGEWYSLGPDPIMAKPPTTIKPLTAPTWTYINPHSLASSGIYTQGDLDELRSHIMFPAERPAILNTIARGMNGLSFNDQSGSISNLLDEIALKKIASTAWEKTWGTFLKFSSVSAGIIGILMILRGIKLIIDTIIHGYALHTVYGWSLYLIGAFWDSVTYLLLHLSKGNRKTKVTYLCKATSTSDDDNPENPPGYNKQFSRVQTCTNFGTEPLNFSFDPKITDLQENPNQARFYIGSPYENDKLNTSRRYSMQYPREHKQQVLPRSASLKKCNLCTPAPGYDTLPAPRPVNKIEEVKIQNKIPEDSVETNEQMEEPSTSLYPKLTTMTEETPKSETSRERPKYLSLDRRRKKSSK